MFRFIKGLIATGLLMLALLVAGIGYSTVKEGTSLENASTLFTMGLGFLIPLFFVLGPIGALLLMWKSPAGRFSGVIQLTTRRWGNDRQSWIYGKVRIGGRDAGTTVVSDAMERLWQDTKNHSQHAEALKMGRALVALRSPQGSRKDWNLAAMRVAYPVTCHVMLFASLVGVGLLWLVPVYFWGSRRANQVLNASTPLKTSWAGARL